MLIILLLYNKSMSSDCHGCMTAGSNGYEKCLICHSQQNICFSERKSPYVNITHWININALIQTIIFNIIHSTSFSDEYKYIINLKLIKANKLKYIICFLSQNTASEFYITKAIQTYELEIKEFQKLEKQLNTVAK